MKILIASHIDPDAVKELQEHHQVICAYDAPQDVLKASIDGCDVMIFRSGVKVMADVMEKAPDLKLIIRAGSGTDNLDLDYVRSHGIKLVRVPEPGAKAVAEMCLAFMLALSRNMLEADRQIRKGHWIKHEITGHLLEGKTLGVIGVGNIGSRVSQIAEAIGMEVIGCVEHYSPERAAEMSTKGIRLTNLDEVVSKADYVSIHVPLKDSTRNLITAEVIARMKPGVFLINLARGGVVDEAALYKAMTEDSRVRGAALDVHKEEGEGKISPLVDLPNVILTPHIGATTIDTQREIGCRIIETVHAFSSAQVQTIDESDLIRIQNNKLDRILD
jgi:D-3-phosphoglycerate dehydrogenase / 2-oxoglutarate reductase